MLKTDIKPSLKASLKKNVYSYRNSFTHYLELHREYNLREVIKACFLKNLGLNTRENEIKILDAGTGNGNVLNLPLIEDALLNEYSLIIDGFDNSNYMTFGHENNNGYLQNLRSLINSTDKINNYSLKTDKKSTIQFHKRSNTYSVRSSVDLLELNDYVKYYFNTRDYKYDVLLAMFVLHHKRDNWINGFDGIYKMLNDKSVIVTAERAEDMSLLDSSPYNINSNFLKQSELHPENHELYFFIRILLESLSKVAGGERWEWDNQTFRATNYSPLFTYIGFKGYRFINDKSSGFNHFYFPFSYIVTPGDIINWFENGVIANLRYGIDNKTKKSVVKSIYDKFGDSDFFLKQFTFFDGYKLFFLKK